MQQLARFLAATGHRLRTLGKVISHFLRKGKLGLKLAIKIPFFVKIEASFRPIGTGADEARPRPASAGLASVRHRGARAVTAFSLLSE
ncbi:MULTISPECIES: hypothetical protein [Rhizobium]|uniref:hypothetical protein n=1 Tax=Rhizobium TaxID=379 RepID=UPI0013E8B298|nr:MULTISPECIES: hypothetical protein [Rhizobium]